MVNGASFLLSSLLLWTAMNNVPSDIKIIAVRLEQVTVFRKLTWIGIGNLPLLETAIANSLIFVVVLSMSTKAMVLEASATQLSFFWFGATGCAFLSHFLLSRFTKASEFLFQFERKYGYLQVIPISLGLLTSNITLLLLSQWLFSILNPLTTNQSRTDFYRAYGRDENKALGLYAMRNVLTNCIILSFSLFILFGETRIQNMLSATALIILIILRWGIATRIRQQVNYLENEAQ